jgi:hypothetical protein
MKPVAKQAFDGLRPRRPLALREALQGTEPRFGRQRLDILHECHEKLAEMTPKPRNFTVTVPD